MLGYLPRVAQLKGGGPRIQNQDHVDPKSVQFLHRRGPFIIT